MNKKSFMSLIAALLSVVLCLFAFGCGGTEADPTDSSTPDEHTHNLTKVEAKAATCEAEGNIEYYTCSGCDKLFADAEGQTEVTAQAVVVAKAHVFETVEGEDADVYGNGVVEHQECTECGAFGINGVETDRTDWVAYYDYIAEILPGKTKHMNQTGGETEYVTVEKDGKQVKAAYFKNSNGAYWVDTADGTLDDNRKDENGVEYNWGFSEFRIDFEKYKNVAFNVVSISFDYKMSENACSGFCNMSDNTDKSYGMQHVIEYKHKDGTKTAYNNVTKPVHGATFLTMDNQWHTFTLNVEQNDMLQILLKLYHFSGEMWVTNYRVNLR